jgi:hypothetical protein
LEGMTVHASYDSIPFMDGRDIIGHIQ